MRKTTTTSASKKTTKAKHPPASPWDPIPRMFAPAGGGVNVRMYRQGLGDCFLLAFPKTSGDDPFYMLIDCGVIIGQVAAPERPSINEVAEHIAASTGNHLHLLVATHQHWDHLSGFVDAFDVFNKKKITVDRIWLAWTENPADKIAQELRTQRAKTERTLRAAAARMRSAADSDAEFAAAFEGVLGFLGPSSAIADGASGGKRTTEAALQNLRSLAKPVYLRPDNEPLTLDGVEGIRVYPLGPPHDKSKIKRYNDRASDPQTYRAAELAFDAQVSFLGAALGLTEPSEASISDAFDYRHRVDDKRKAELNNLAFSPKDSWRKVDLAWLHASSALALALDNATNNTSLALAIELQPGGAVLLFPADAQVGNWLSWHDQNWQSGDKQVTAEDLLSRTVLYKVGHHASHNATLRQRGLELMTHEDLTALVPLDVVTAKKKKWPMPWPNLKKELLIATKGRILQVDDEDEIQDRECPTATPKLDWAKFQKSVKTDRLYFEITIG